MLCGDFAYDTNFKRAIFFWKSLGILHLSNIILESIYLSIYLLSFSKWKVKEECLANAKFFIYPFKKYEKIVTEKQNKGGLFRVHWLCSVGIFIF